MFHAVENAAQVDIDDTLPLVDLAIRRQRWPRHHPGVVERDIEASVVFKCCSDHRRAIGSPAHVRLRENGPPALPGDQLDRLARAGLIDRSEEHTSELQSIMRISYAVFC